MIKVQNLDRRGKYSNAHVGVFSPQHPEKVCSDGQLQYKSELERCFMSYADKNPAIVSWGYEKTVVKYLD